MLKFVVLFATTVAFGGAQDASSVLPSAETLPPTPISKQCKLDYLEQAQMCSTVPTLIDGKQYEQCYKGKKMRGHRGGSEGKGYRGEERDVAPGEGRLEAMTASSSKREPRRGMKIMGRSGKRGHGGKGAGCFNCMMECVFNSSGLLDASSSVDIAAVRTTFVAKAAATSPWGALIGTAVDSCWTDTQNAPPPTPPPGASADKKQCKHHPLLLLQCIHRNLFINTPDSEQVNKAGDCDARMEHLKNCDPMVPGSMDKKWKKGRRSGGEFGDAEYVPVASAVAKRGKQPEKLRRKSKKASKIAA